MTATIQELVEGALKVPTLAFGTCAATDAGTIRQVRVASRMVLAIGALVEADFLTMAILLLISGINLFWVIMSR